MTDTDPDSGPMPRMTRRNYLKGVMTTAAVAGVGSTTSQSALADVGTYMTGTGPASMSLVDWAAGEIDQMGDVNESPDVNEISLHQTAMSAKEWFDSATIYAQNHLTDAKTIAHVEARHAIATAYENGKTESEAKAAAVSAIESYYDEALFQNHISALCGSLIQLAHVSQAARSVSDSDITDDFISNYTCVDSYSGTASTTPTDQYLGEVVETELTAPNGTKFTVDCPNIVVVLDNGDEYRSPITDEWINSANVVGRDPLLGEVTVTTADGNDMVLRYEPGVVNVPSSNLQSHDVWDTSVFARDVVDMTDHINTVTTNYDLAFVGDIYTALDNGDITTTQVRGSSSMARHLAGGDAEVTGDAYKLAMYQQLELENPDLSQTASMSVTYSGGTSWGRDTSNGSNPELYPADVENGSKMSGLCYGLLSSSYKKGATYLTNPVLWVCSGSLKAVDPDTGNVLRSYSMVGDVTCATLSAKGERIYMGSTAGNIKCINLATDTEVWTSARSTWDNNTMFDIVTVGEGTNDYDTNGWGQVVVSHSGGVSSLPADTGEYDSTQSHSFTKGYTFNDSHLLTPDGKRIFIDDDDLYALDKDGSTIASGASQGGRVELDPKGNLLGLGYDGSTRYVYRYNADDLSIINQWSYSFGNSWGGIKELNGSDHWYVCGEGQIVKFDPAAGTNVWTRNIGTWTRRIHVLPDESVIVPSLGANASTVKAWDSSGNELWTMAANPNSDVFFGYEEMNDRPNQYDGVIRSATFYDSSDSTEHNLVSGALTIDAMTDTQGSDIETVTQDTISDLESQATNYSDISNIVAQIDSLDSADDIDGVDDLKLIAKQIDGIQYDGVTDSVTIQEQQTEQPEYDSYDTTKWANYIDKVDTQYQDALNQHYEEQTSDPVLGSTDGSGVDLLDPFGIGRRATLAVYAGAGLLGLNALTN